MKHLNRCEKCGKFVKKGDFLCEEHLKNSFIIKNKSWYTNKKEKVIKEINKGNSISYEYKDYINKDDKIFIYWYRFRRNNKFEI